LRNFRNAKLWVIDGMNSEQSAASIITFKPFVEKERSPVLAGCVRSFTMKF